MDRGCSSCDFNPGDHCDFAAIHSASVERYRVVPLDWPGYGQSPVPVEPRNSSAMRFADTLVRSIFHPRF